MLWQFSCENKELQEGKNLILQFNKDTLGFWRNNVNTVNYVQTPYYNADDLNLCSFKNSWFNNAYTKEEKTFIFSYIFVVHHFFFRDY